MIYRIFAVLVFIVVIGGTIFFGGQQTETPRRRLSRAT